MSARQLLEQTRTFDDLARLVAALGAVPAREEIPIGYWRQHTSESLPLTRSGLIGLHGQLPWYGVETRDLLPALRRIARNLEGRGEPAAILGIDPEGGIALTVAFDRRPCCRLLPAEDFRIVETCLARIAAIPNGGRLATAARLAEILSLEGLSSRFFAAFENALERMSATVEQLRPAHRRSLALLQLNRILFLYFIQSKGWLDGKPDFLRLQVDRCLRQRKQLDHHLLRPLFFGTLNRPAEERKSTARNFGSIPFLNGGLFEPHPLEREWKGSFPNPAWQQTFDDVFERFHFTAAEGSETAIAPDMLGRVFEGVMAREERRRSGTFYTPPALVQALLDESLTALVAEDLKVPFPVAAELFHRRDPALLPTLKSITLLDPAVGSGAFLLCALERLSDLQGTSAGKGGGRRRDILRRNLFGVDINPTAVRLTELRLWLAVVADDPTDQPGQVTPLPNLDCLIRQGDSLTDPLGLIARMPFRAGAMGATLAQLRLSFSGATGAAKRDAAVTLRKAEQSAMKDCLDRAEHQLHYGIAECLAKADASDLFGRSHGLDLAATQRMRELRGKLTPIRQARRRLEQEGEVGWFQYESHFEDVFSQRGGFDLVVGNPPWVRAEQLPRAVREQLGQRYHWWRTRGTSAGYRHQPDLAVAFLERAHELTRPGGVVGLLLPAKITSAGYATSARRALARDLTLHTVSDLGTAYPGVFQATVYPLALVSGKRKPASDHPVRLRLNDPESPCLAQRELGAAPWVIRQPAAVGIVHQLAERFPPLGSRYPVQLGVKTGANNCFLEPPETVEQALVRGAFRGRDLRPFRIVRSIPLFWPYSEDLRVLPSLPPGARTHAAACLAKLEARVDYAGGPPWTLFRTSAAMAVPRVVWADLSRGIAATCLSASDRRVPLNTCYVIRCREDTEALCLSGWLNSSWIRGIARLHADPASGGFARFNARTVGLLPLPDSVWQDERMANWARHALTHQHLQSELDELTAPHLGLPAESLRILAAAG